MVWREEAALHGNSPSRLRIYFASSRELPQQFLALEDEIWWLIHRLDTRRAAGLGAVGIAARLALQQSFVICSGS